MASHETNRSFLDGILATVPEKIRDSERWRNVKELLAVHSFDGDKNTGIGRFKSIGANKFSFVGPVDNRKLVCVPYKENMPTPPDEFEVLDLSPERFKWKNTDKTQFLLPPDAFYTGVNTDFGLAYVGKHDQYGIGMVLELENPEGLLWTYISTNGEKSLSFKVLCYP